MVNCIINTFLSINNTWTYIYIFFSKIKAFIYIHHLRFKKLKIIIFFLNLLNYIYIINVFKLIFILKVSINSKYIFVISLLIEIKTYIRVKEYILLYLANKNNENNNFT